ncbi:hypothetical protein ZWY2020_053994 [Hordeum vulgare]|nr:hypothetical protein ZWY2020_053994 [Hordeum vulgare]
MALLRLQQHCSLLETSTSHLPTLPMPPRNPRKSQLSPPNAARTASSCIAPSPAAQILARNVAAPWRGELLLLQPGRSTSLRGRQQAGGFGVFHLRSFS